MKKSLLFLSLLLFASCEEMTDTDFSMASPSLVIDSYLYSSKGKQIIELSTSSRSHESEILKFTETKIYVTDTSNNVFKFIEEKNLISNTRRFTCNNFTAEAGETYTLTIIYNGQTFIVSEKTLNEPSIIQIIDF